jgi:phosphoribosylformylglycinamidine synthase
MILFFKLRSGKIIAASAKLKLPAKEIDKLKWLFGEAMLLDDQEIKGSFIGPRKEMITPWSTNAVEITQNMGIDGIKRIEEFFPLADAEPEFDPMLQALYKDPGQDLFTIEHMPESIILIKDIKQYNDKEGLALTDAEIDYLVSLASNLGRLLTDSEVFGFSQVNSEHCRHKIFNGIFIIDGNEKDSTLFQLIKNTTHYNRNRVVSAYKDNCAFIRGPVVEQFAPISQDKPDFFTIKNFESVLSLKAETHNFPTTVEPFIGAST